MGGAQPREPDQLGVHLGFLNHERIAGRDGFDLGVGQCGRVQVFKAADGHVAAHHLGDELRLRLQGLPHVGVERAFGDVAVNLDDGILVALPENPPLALLHVGRSPRRIEMMQGNQPLLHVRARTHLLRAAEKDADLARAHIPEQRELRGVGIVVLNEGDFAARHAQPLQLVAPCRDKPRSPCLSAWRGRRRQAGRNAPASVSCQMRKMFSTARLTLPCGSSGAAGFISRRSKRRLPPLGRDFQHVVFAADQPGRFSIVSARAASS